jgi:nicotinate dehydrogenase subunit A
LPESPALVLRLNGGFTPVSSAGDTPLLYVLRDELGLVGTRFGCGEGSCRACVVLVDGRPQTSCDTPVSAVVGRSLVTIEGLAHEDQLDPVQHAFLDVGAGQCGYCLSGIILAARALLDEDPAPSGAAIRAALDGHLCRCGAHGRIIAAVRVAAERTAGSSRAAAVIDDGNARVDA